MVLSQFQNRAFARERQGQKMNRLKTEKELAIVSALVEGVSIRSIERMTGVHRDTIMRLLNRVGERCSRLLDQHMVGFHSRLIQVDEIWTFCKKKEQRLTEAEQINPELGDQRSEEHTSELQSPLNIVCRLLLEK